MTRLALFVCSILLGLFSQVTSRETQAYDRISSVLDYANIALDLKSIEAQLATGTQGGKDAAFNIYSKGGYAMPYANLTLIPPLSLGKIEKGTKVLGENLKGNGVNGIVIADAVKGDAVLQIQYIFPDDENMQKQCHVGGIPKPITEGCFVNSGDLLIGQANYAYVYDIIENTHNAITLQGFSTQAEDAMAFSEERYFASFRRFNKYYGRPDYGNEWITAAFSNRPTDLLNGNAQFEGYDNGGTAEAIVNGIAFLNVWMYIIRQMELALDLCSQSCVGCVEESAKAWDVAVALYSGSNTNSPSSNGMLLFTLAETMCETFGTCTNGVNAQIFGLFNEGKDLLLDDKCGPVEKNIEMITSLMTVPLVQGMLYEKYRADKFSDSNKKVEAKGATFAAALLPFVDFCNPNWAGAVYSNMRLGYNEKGSYEVAKDAIQRQYECLGIFCEDVGGIINPSNGQYFENAEPCGISPISQSNISENNNQSTLALNNAAIGGISAGVIAVVIILALLIMRRTRREKNINQPSDLEISSTKDGGAPKIV